MSVWNRLFNQSKSPHPKSRPSLGLESMEAREVPAVLGGEAIYRHEFGHGLDTTGGASGVPAVGSTTGASTVARQSVEADYSAIAFVGGWGASIDQLDHGSMTTPEPHPKPIIIITEYLLLGTEYPTTASTSTSGGRDDSIGGSIGVDTLNGGYGYDRLNRTGSDMLAVFDRDG